MLSTSLGRLRGALAKIGSLIALAYRHGYSRARPPRCRYIPTCSEYAELAIEAHGFWRGAWKTCRRVLSCTPWKPLSVDYPKKD